jgi:hypothetical protein
MRIRLNDPALVPDLLETLESRPDVVAHVIDAERGEMEISLLGSLNFDAMRMELYLRVRAWEAARSGRGAAVEIDDP